MRSRKKSRQQREALQKILNAHAPYLCLRGTRLETDDAPIIWRTPPFGGTSDSRYFEAEDGRQVRIRTVRAWTGRVYFMADEQLTLPFELDVPMNGEFILHLLLSKEDQEVVMGDLIERYGQKRERFGEQRARVWFYCEVLRSVWPLLRRAIARAGALIAAAEWLRRHIS